MPDDLYDDPQIKAMLQDFRRRVMPNIKDSHFALTLLAGGIPDVKQCLEVGASVLMDKPILVLCINKAQCPRHLLKIASEVVEVEDIRSPEGSKKVQEAIRRVAEGVA